MAPLPPRSHVQGLLLWCGITAVAAVVGAVGSASAPTFYAMLELPSWAPPGWVFGPVWMGLYGCMAFAAWLVWRVGGVDAAGGALALFCAQLVCNALWSWLFFAWHLGGWAFADILVLMGLVTATLAAFWRVRPLAGWLLVPYWLWVGFAAFLNHAIWQLNPGMLG
ncbi:MAG: TspO/MBR family protein [Thermodesulfobacteriota bacterium]